MIRPQRQTSVLVLDVPSWAKEADVREGLAAASVILQNVATFAIWGGRDDRGYGLVIIMVSCNVAIRLVETGVVVVGWTRCRVWLLERMQPKYFRCQGSGHLAAECKGPSKPQISQSPKQPEPERQQQQPQQGKLVRAYRFFGASCCQHRLGADLFLQGERVGRRRYPHARGCLWEDLRLESADGLRERE